MHKSHKNKHFKQVLHQKLCVRTLNQTLSNTSSETESEPTLLIQICSHKIQDAGRDGHNWQRLQS